MCCKQVASRDFASATFVKSGDRSAVAKLAFFCNCQNVNVLYVAAAANLVVSYIVVCFVYVCVVSNLTVMDDGLVYAGVPFNVAI